MSEQTSQEPTMEEILASIRRIISEDDAPAAEAEATPEAEAAPEPAPAPVVAAAPEPEPEADVLDLTDEMALPDPAPQVAFKKVEPPDDLEFTETAAKAPLRDMAFDLPPPSPMDSPPILSRSTVSAVESAFNSLAHTVLSNNARTLEDLVKEMLRPMLKSWLDDNLPGLVERIVKAEIERVSRGR